MSIINRLLKKISETKWRYVLKKSTVRIVNGAKFHVGRNVSIKRSRIFVREGSLTIEDGCVVDNVNIYIDGGSLVIGRKSIIKGLPICMLLVENGEMVVQDHVRLQCKRVWLRFGGRLRIGNYTTVNEGSEIRCDESVSIGSYCQISHDVVIWDTNTHCITTPIERKQSFEKYYPYFGKEMSRPKTLPIAIGDYCWIGERSAILKGTRLNDNVTVGFNTTVIGEKVNSGITVVSDICNRKF